MVFVTRYAVLIGIIPLPVSFGYKDFLRSIWAQMVYTFLFNFVETIYTDPEKIVQIVKILNTILRLWAKNEGMHHCTID